MDFKIFNADDFNRMKAEIVNELKSTMEHLIDTGKTRKITLNTKDVVEEYGLSDSTQRNYRKQGVLPYMKMEGEKGMILYEREKLEAALRSYYKKMSA